MLGLTNVVGEGHSFWTVGCFGDEGEIRGFIANFDRHGCIRIRFRKLMDNMLHLAEEYKVRLKHSAGRGIFSKSGGKTVLNLDHGVGDGSIPPYKPWTKSNFFKRY